jgi:hypothetical protein
MAESDVSRIRRQIALEYEAAHHIFTDFTPTARHAYITKRQQNIEGFYQELKKIVTPEEAMAIIVQAENDTYCSPSSGNTSKH